MSEQELIEIDAKSNKELSQRDRRVRRTKKLLQQGLIDLLKEKGLASITVRELSEHCDVNRGTFYLYFRDIHDMVEQIEAELMEEMQKVIRNHPGKTILLDTDVFLKDLFYLIYENRDLCAALLSDNGDISFLKKINEMVMTKCWQDTMSIRGSVNEMNFDYIYSFLTSGIMGVITSWLRRGCRETPDKVAAKIYEMMHEPIIPDREGILAIARKQQEEALREAMQKRM